MKEHTDVENQNIDDESKVGAAAPSEGDSAVFPGQDVPKDSTATSSPNTDSPVLVNVDVSADGSFIISYCLCLSFYM